MQTCRTHLKIKPFCRGLIWDSSQDDIEDILGCSITDGWQVDFNSVRIDGFRRREGDEGTDWFNLGNGSWKIIYTHKTF